ncbi:hypothetical protein OQA88_11906 [Cercophora sp. LCS_1]
MPSDKASYLAAHYLSASKPPSKKRKTKHKKSSTSSGLLIQDDDEPGWAAPAASDSEPETPTVVAGHTAEFRRAKKSGWQTLSGAAVPPPKDDVAAAADAIIASAAADQAALARLADDEPEPKADIPMMSDGTHAGLQSAAAITAQIKARQEAEREQLARMQAQRAAAGDVEEEVIMRDATGRRVDVAMRRAEMRRAQAEAERVEEEKKRALKGEVQLTEARRRREELEDAKLMPLARGKDDEEMNKEMKEEARWNDPMAQFLAVDSGGGGKGKSKSRRPVYKGGFAPNRYGIRPGYRWDGVDRGNGFEAERFKAFNRRERNKGLEYAWQMDE